MRTHMNATNRASGVSDRLVLCYHAISERWHADLCVSPERLEAQLLRLVERGYRGATFTDAVTGRPTGKTLAVTFDDAYRSVLELGLPLLSRLGLPATVFAPTAFVGSPRPACWPGVDRWVGGEHETELAVMSWEELEQLASAGWEIGSHTQTHPRLTSLGDSELAAELRGSLVECERRLGRPCVSLAYPYGDVDARVTRAAVDAGYAAGATLSVASNGGSPFWSPRVGVYHEDGMGRFSLKVSRSVRRLRSARSWRPRERQR